MSNLSIGRRLRSINQSINRTIFNSATYQPNSHRCHCLCQRSFSTLPADDPTYDNQSNDQSNNQSSKKSNHRSKSSNKHSKSHSNSHSNQATDQSHELPDVQPRSLIESRSELLKLAETDANGIMNLLMHRYSNSLAQPDFNRLVRFCREQKAYPAAMTLLKYLNQSDSDFLDREADEFGERRPRKVSMVTECFNEFLALFVQLKELKIAQELIDKYIDLPAYTSIPASNHSVDQSVNPTLNNGSIEQPVNPALKVEPNTFTYNLVTKTLHQTNQNDKALALANYLLDHSANQSDNQSSESHSQPQSVILDRHSYAAMLTVFTRCRAFNQVERIEKLIDGSIDRLIEDDPGILSLLMEANLWLKRWGKVLYYFDLGLKNQSIPHSPEKTKKSKPSSKSPIKPRDKQLREPVFSFAIQAASVTKQHQRAADIYEMAVSQSNIKQSTSRSQSPALTSSATYEFLFYSLYSINQSNKVIDVYRSLLDTSVVWRGWAINYVVQAIKQTGDIQYLPRLLARNLESNPADQSITTPDIESKSNRVDMSTLETALETCLNHAIKSTKVQSADQSINETIKQSTPMFLTLIQLFKRHSIKLSVNMYLMSMRFFVHFGEAAQVEKVRLEMSNQSIKEHDFTHDQYVQLINCLLAACQMTGDWHCSLELLNQLKMHQKSLAPPKKSSNEQSADSSVNDDDDDEWDFSDELVDRFAFNGGLSILGAHDEWATVIQLFDEVLFASVNQSVDVLASNSQAVQQSTNKSTSRSIIPTLSSCQLAIHACMQVKDWSHALMIYHRMQLPDWSSEHSKEKILTDAESMREFIDQSINESDSITQFSVDVDSIATMYDTIIYCCYQLNDATLANRAYHQSVNHLKTFNELPTSSSLTTLMRIWTEAGDDQSISQLLDSVDEDMFEQIEIQAVNQALNSMFNRVMSQTNNYFIRQSTNQSISQSTSQSDNQSINQSDHPTCDQLIDLWQHFSFVCSRVSHLMTSIGALSSAPTNVHLSHVPRDQRINQYQSSRRVFNQSINQLYTFDTFPLVVRPDVSMRGSVMNQSGEIYHWDESENITGCAQLGVALVAWTRIIYQSINRLSTQSINQSINQSIPTTIQTSECCDVLLIPPHGALIDNADRLIELSMELMDPPVYHSSLHVRNQLVDCVTAMSEQRTKIIQHAQSIDQSKNSSDMQKRMQHIHRNYAQTEEEITQDKSLTWGVLVKTKEIDRIVQVMKMED